MISKMNKGKKNAGFIVNNILQKSTCDGKSIYKLKREPWINLLNKYPSGFLAKCSRVKLYFLSNRVIFGVHYF